MKHNMMRTLAVLLSVLLAIGCVPFAASADRSASAAGDLSNLAYILNDESDTDLRIVYLGGSVTEGVGSIRHDTDSWRALVGQYFTDLGEKYGKTVTNINAAIGATGSYFGAYRFYRDGLFKEGAPDVLFIEFSINDVYDSLDGEAAALYYESIIRQSYAINPYIQIIPVFTTDINFVNSYLATGDECNECFSEHHAVAVHYSLPELNVGCILADKMADEAGKRSFTDNDPVWDKYITDTCHPTNEGYKVYANAIIDSLRSQLFENGVLRTGSKTAVELDRTPAYCVDSDRLIRHGRYISFKDAGFTEENLHGFALNATDGESYKSSSNGTITSDKVNASFAYTFKGRGTGFYSIGNNTNRGALKWKITATDDPTVSYSGTVSLVKDYWMDLAFPAPIINGLEDREWLCECVLTATGSGSSAELRYIYVDGDETSVHAAAAPDTDLDNPGEIAYVSSTGSVTVDGEIKEAYTAIPDAINALGIGGGRIFFTGTQTFADALDGRAKVTIIGLDDSAALDNNKIIVTKGDLELQNLKLTTDSPGSSYTSGRVLTFGGGIRSEKPIRYAFAEYATGVANKINFYSGTYGDGSASGGYSNPHSVNGDTVYNYYGGSFGTIYSIARETKWDSAQSNVNGNVYLNVYGGTFGSIYPAYTMGLLNKSLCLTVNGGTFGTSEQKANLSYGSENGFKASSNCTLHAEGDYVLIFNNAEIKKAGGSLANANVGVGHSNAQYDVATDGKKIIVSNNHELAVDNGLDLARNKADVVLTVTGGKAELVRNADGIAEGYTLTPDEEGFSPFVGEEELIGEDGVFALINGETDIVFKDASAQQTIVYVKQSAQSSGDGLSEDSPVRTIAEAAEIGGTDADYTILFLDAYSEDAIDLGAAHSGILTLSSAEGGSLSWKSSFKTMGAVKFENISLMPLAEGNFVKSNASAVTMGENVKILSCDGTNTYFPCLHVGAGNADTMRQYFTIKSGSANYVYVGPYYVWTGSTKSAAGAKITVDGGDVKWLTLGPDSWSPSALGGVNFTGTVTVLYNGGTIENIWKGTPKVTYKATQFIANNGLSFPLLPEETDNGSRYVIESTAGGYVSDTETAGTFTIVSETGLLYIDGVKTELSADNRYTLASGNHTVSYGLMFGFTADGKGVYYDEESKSVTIAADSTAAFTEESILSRYGEIFVGWYKDGAPVKNGDTLRAGDILTARFVATDPAVEFCVIGAQIRLTGKEGLRFVNEMSLELFDLLKNTDIVFTQKTESDDTNSGCGFVILPESYLADGDSLTLGTENACAVAAKKIFAADEHAFRYTVCVTDIVSENYARRYAVVPYIAYTSANGVECVFYGDRYAASLADIAEAALADESAALTEDEKARLEAFAAAKANA